MIFAFVHENGFFFFAFQLNISRQICHSRDSQTVGVFSCCRPRTGGIGVFLCRGPGFRYVCLASQGKVPAWGNGPKIRMEKGGKEKGEGAAFESTSLSSIERFLGGGSRF